MLTILKPGQGTVAVMILITAAGQADILKTGHQGRFVYFYYMDVCFPSQTLKQDLVQAQKENSQLKSENENAEAKLKTLTEAMHR